jgi:hypothetical protein
MSVTYEVDGSFILWLLILWLLITLGLISKLKITSQNSGLRIINQISDHENVLELYGFGNKIGFGVSL